MNVYQTIAVFLAKQLDKLKIKSPVAFLLVQTLIGLLLGLFVKDTINIPDIQFLVNLSPLFSSDTIVISLLGALMAIIGPRTSLLAATK